MGNYVTDQWGSRNVEKRGWEGGNLTLPCKKGNASQSVEQYRYCKEAGKKAKGLRVSHRCEREVND